MDIENEYEQMILRSKWWYFLIKKTILNVFMKGFHLGTENAIERFHNQQKNLEDFEQHLKSWHLRINSEMNSTRSHRDKLQKDLTEIQKRYQDLRAKYDKMRRSIFEQKQK